MARFISIAWAGVGTLAPGGNGLVDASRRMGWQAALEYVQQTHPGTSPLPESWRAERLAIATASNAIQQPAVA